MNERKDMSGILFVNDKGDNPKRPDYRGEIVVEGIVYKLSGWKKADKNSKPFLSLKVEQFGEQSDRPAQAEGEDMPF